MDQYFDSKGKEVKEGDVLLYDEGDGRHRSIDVVYKNGKEELYSIMKFEYDFENKKWNYGDFTKYYLKFYTQDPNNNEDNILEDATIIGNLLRDSFEYCSMNIILNLRIKYDLLTVDRYFWNLI